MAFRARVIALPKTWAPRPDPLRTVVYRGRAPCRCDEIPAARGLAGAEILDARCEPSHVLRPRSARPCTFHDPCCVRGRQSTGRRAPGRRRGLMTAHMPRRAFAMGGRLRILTLVLFASLLVALLWLSGPARNAALAEYDRDRIACARVYDSVACSCA